jgi:hypothetical protein
MKRCAVVLSVLTLTALVPVTSASAEVVRCPTVQTGGIPLGTAACHTVGAGVVQGRDLFSAGPGGGSSQVQWRRTISVPEVGTLRLRFVMSHIDLQSAKLGVRLTASQTGCPEARQDTAREFLPDADGRVRGTVSASFACSGPLEFRVTIREATFRTTGSYTGRIESLLLQRIETPAAASPAV